MTLPRPPPFVLPLFGVLLHAIGFAVPARAADIPKDKSAFTVYVQNKLQLYSPSPINLVGPLSLSVGTANAAAALPSLKTLYKRCKASPSTCDHAVNDYVQDVARAIQAPPATAATPRQTPVATEKPSCTYIDGPNANPHDRCAPPIIDLYLFPPYLLRTTPTKSGEVDPIWVRLRVQADGSVGDVVLLHSSGFSLFDAAAIRQVKGRHYFPATKNGRPVDIQIKSLIRCFVGGTLGLPLNSKREDQLASPEAGELFLRDAVILPRMDER